MASYMVLFIFSAMILFLTDARPSYETWPDTKDYNNVFDADDEINRLIHERENSERQLRSLKANPEFFIFAYQQRRFRHHTGNSKGYKKRSIKLNDYDQSEYDNNPYELM